MHKKYARSDTGLLLQATRFAAHKHRNQRRKDAKDAPYINHPIVLASILHEEGGAFGAEVADIVVELTDVKFLQKETRKRVQVSRARRASEAAKAVKLADKIGNLRDMLGSPPAGWTATRRQK